MKPPFRIAPSDLSHDTAEAHAQVHRHAKEGKALGTAMVVMYQDGLFITTVTGECQRSPVWSIGAIDMLKAKVRRLAESAGD